MAKKKEEYIMKTFAVTRKSIITAFKRWQRMQPENIRKSAISDMIVIPYERKSDGSHQCAIFNKKEKTRLVSSINIALFEIRQLTNIIIEDFDMFASPKDYIYPFQNSSFTDYIINKEPNPFSIIKDIANTFTCKERKKRFFNEKTVLLKIFYDKKLRLRARYFNLMKDIPQDLHYMEYYPHFIVFNSTSLTSGTRIVPEVSIERNSFDDGMIETIMEGYSSLDKKELIVVKKSLRNLKHLIGKKDSVILRADILQYERYTLAIFYTDFIQQKLRRRNSLCGKNVPLGHYKITYCLRKNLSHLPTQIERLEGLNIGFNGTNIYNIFGTNFADTEGTALNFCSGALQPSISRLSGKLDLYDTLMRTVLMLSVEPYGPACSPLVWYQNLSHDFKRKHTLQKRKFEKDNRNYHELCQKIDSNEVK